MAAWTRIKLPQCHRDVLNACCMQGTRLGHRHGEGRWKGSKVDILCPSVHRSVLPLGQLSRRTDPTRWGLSNREGKQVLSTLRGRDREPQAPISRRYSPPAATVRSCSASLCCRVQWTVGDTERVQEGTKAVRPLAQCLAHCKSLKNSILCICL